MSDPPAPSPPKPRPARWLDRLSALFVLAAAVGAAVAAAPSILRATGVETPAPLGAPPRPSVQPPGEPPRSPGAPSAHRPGTYGFEENPRFAPDDVEPRITELERLYPDGMWPGRRDPRGSRPGADSAAGPRTIRTRSPLLLHERADPASPPTGQVPAAATITILREAGEWSLVVHQRAEGVTMGWARRGEISPL